MTVLLGDIPLLAFETILVLFSRHRKTAVLQLHKFLFTTAQISVYNCTNFLTTAQSVHNCTLKKTLSPWIDIMTTSDGYGHR